eukprot:926038-Rhodomonas_salina.4
MKYSQFKFGMLLREKVDLVCHVSDSWYPLYDGILYHSDLSFQGHAQSPSSLRCHSVTGSGRRDHRIGAGPGPVLIFFF